MSKRKPSPNPYDLPTKPNLTIKEVMERIVAEGEVALDTIVEAFDITPGDASVRLLKLYRWGYLRRKKSPVPPKVYHYWPTAFGRKSVKRWKKEGEL